MSKQQSPALPQKASVVTSNNDVVYLWWSFPEKIPGCLGFSIHRINGNEEIPLIAGIGFDAQKDTREGPQNTDAWPIQSYNWKDLDAPSNVPLTYKIIPMVGTWNSLTPLLEEAIVTQAVVRRQEFGEARIIFNRGLLSTQAFTKGGKDAIAQIGITGSPWRKRLAGEMLENFEQFFSLGEKQGGKYYASLYELTDEELFGHLTRYPSTEIILSNANGSKDVTVDGETKTVTVDDKTNIKSRNDLHELMKAGRITVYDRMLGGHIGHNKFVVYINAQGTAQKVLTGSTNWTATGLCGQTNNLVIIESPELAKKYLDYWEQLKADKKQDTPLRDWCRENSFETGTKTSSYKLWFSPNTIQKNKPKVPDTPIDVADIFRLIENAKKSILFLVFNPGNPSIIQKIREVSKARPKDDPLFVRGAISDAKIAKQVMTEIYSTNALSKPDIYKVGAEEITGVAAIPSTFSYWEEELLKLGHATIHDKLLVIDPFDKDCVVVTGSHNLGYKASYTNDENMLLIKGNIDIAKAYATHVLDVVNHFKWRYSLQSKMPYKASEEVKRKILEARWKDLSEDDNWQNYYFGKSGFIDQYRLFLR